MPQRVSSTGFEQFPALHATRIAAKSSTQSLRTTSTPSERQRRRAGPAGKRPPHTHIPREQVSNAHFARKLTASSMLSRWLLYIVLKGQPYQLKRAHLTPFAFNPLMCAHSKRVLRMTRIVSTPSLTSCVMQRLGPIAHSTQERADNGTERFDSIASIHRGVEARVTGNRTGNQGIAGEYYMVIGQDVCAYLYFQKTNCLGNH